ncbi:hypothetical protein Pmani_037877 [Petrolisthes manimaculis]|uniref:Uncharacterized protein n=1 Tax=Petrolisthes manimaculis TaxID=1843537 RepID=A0AAE1NFF8_9EUCA|nr:hypothetical protein Pmani_037877 [Petrolisthes manimaculis]
MNRGKGREAFKVGRVRWWWKEAVTVSGFVMQKVHIWLAVRGGRLSLAVALRRKKILNVGCGAWQGDRSGGVERREETAE